MSGNQTPIYKTEFNAFDKKTSDQRLQELMDREEIHALISQYANCAAQGEGATMVDLFTEDGKFITHIPGKDTSKINCNNRAEIANLLPHMKRGETMPMIHNVMLSITGDTATGICSIEVRTSENGESVVGSGYYEDQFRRENGKWKFTVREVTMFHWVPLSKGWTKPS